MWESAGPFAMSSKQKSALEYWVRGTKTHQKVVYRSIIVLGTGEGASNDWLAQRLATSRPTVINGANAPPEWVSRAFSTMRHGRGGGSGSWSPGKPLSWKPRCVPSQPMSYTGACMLWRKLKALVLRGVGLLAHLLEAVAQ